MNYLRNPLNASRCIKRSDANIAQTITLRGGVCGDHRWTELQARARKTGQQIDFGDLLVGNRLDGGGIMRLTSPLSAR